MTSGMPGTRVALVNPTTVRPAPAATRIAAGKRLRVAARALPGPESAAGMEAAIAGSVIAPARRISGRRPRNTARQPTLSATMPLNAGPITPGRTQAVDIVANMRGIVADNVGWRAVCLGLLQIGRAHV